MQLEVSNGTTIDVRLVVNGTNVGSIGPQGGMTVEANRLPALPWNAEVQTQSGRRLVFVRVNDGDVWANEHGSGGDAARVDLSCGRIDVWSGPPLLGPMPGPGNPGDCDP
jgi:hypothetical protein